GWSWVNPSRPDEDVILFVDRKGLGFDKLVFQVFQEGIVELEFTFQGAIGDPAPLPQELHHLVQHLIESHRVALLSTGGTRHGSGAPQSLKTLQTSHSTSSDRGPRIDVLGWKRSVCPGTRRSCGSRALNSSRTTRASSRPRGAPRQKCGPCPKE